MERRERWAIWGAVAVLAITGIAGVAIWLSGGLAPRERKLELVESTDAGKLIQRDAATGEILWAVTLGHVQHTVNSKLVEVDGTECMFYTSGHEEMVVKAPHLAVDTATNVLTFDQGVAVQSSGGGDVPYDGHSARLLYYVEDRRATFEDDVTLNYGRSTFYGQTVDTWFAPIEGSGKSRMTYCEVTPMPSPEAGGRAVLAVFALAAAANGSPPAQQEWQFHNAVIRAERLVMDVENGIIRLLGHPEVEMGESTLKADTVLITLNPDKTDEVLRAESEGDVEVRSVHVIEAASALKREKLRVATLTARRAVYSAADRTTTLSGGVSGRLEQPRLRPSTFQGSEIVAGFDEKNTLKSVAATGSPATAEVFVEDVSQGTTTAYQISAGRVVYFVEDPPRVEATGSPLIKQVDESSTYTAERIVAYFRTDDDGTTRADRVELLGSFQAEIRDDKSWAVVGSDHATVFFRPTATGSPKSQSAFVEIRGSPKVTIHHPQSGEVQTVITCAEMDYNPGDSRFEARKDVRIESLTDNTIATGDEAVASLGEQSGKGDYSLTGNVKILYKGGGDQGRRPFELSAARASYNKVDPENPYYDVESAHGFLRATKEGEQDVELIAPKARMYRRTGELVATGRPLVQSGKSTVRADEVRVTVDQGTNQAKEGVAIGNIELHTEVEQKPPAEGGTTHVRLVSGVAQRVVFSPAVAVPEHIPNVPPGTTANRFRLTGNPQLTVTDRDTGHVVAEFRNVEFIDVYSRPQGAYVDSGGAGGGQAELTVTNETPSKSGGAKGQ